MPVTLDDIAAAHATLVRRRALASAEYRERVDIAEQDFKAVLAEGFRDGNRIPAIMNRLGVNRAKWYTYFGEIEMAQLRLEAAQRKATRDA